MRGPNAQYLEHLALLPEFEMWLRLAVQNAQAAGEEVDNEIIDICMPPTLMAMSYRSIYAYENHFWVRSAEMNLSTRDYGVAATFDQGCQSGPNDRNRIRAAMEYIGWIEEILELDYGRFQVLVLLCNWVQAISNGPGATMQRDDYGFPLVNFNRLIPIYAQSFVFPVQVEQVFFSDCHGEPGWRVVLRKEPRGRRIASDMTMRNDIEALRIGDDNEFRGLVAPSTVGAKIPVAPHLEGGCH